MTAATERRDDLIALVYTSTATVPFDDDALDALLAAARRFNLDHGITGLLLHRDDRFIQVLEGPSEAVLALMAAIETDPRHAGVSVLLTEPIQRRRFDDWTMGYRPLAGRADADRDGFRDSFDDLDAGADDDTLARALGELTLWFRVRSGA